MYISIITFIKCQDFNTLLKANKLGFTVLMGLVLLVIMPTQYYPIFMINRIEQSVHGIPTCMWCSNSKGIWTHNLDNLYRSNGCKKDLSKQKKNGCKKDKFITWDPNGNAFSYFRPHHHLFLLIFICLFSYGFLLGLCFPVE